MFLTLSLVCIMPEQPGELTDDLLVHSDTVTRGKQPRPASVLPFQRGAVGPAGFPVEFHCLQKLSGVRVGGSVNGRGSVVPTVTLNRDSLASSDWYPPCRGRWEAL